MVLTILCLIPIPRFFMYVFMVSGISLLMFIIHYVYTTVRRVSGSVVSAGDCLFIVLFLGQVVKLKRLVMRLVQQSFCRSTLLHLKGMSLSCMCC